MRLTRLAISLAILFPIAIVGCGRDNPQMLDPSSPVVRASGAQAQSTTQRSIEEFVAAQGTFQSAPPYNFGPWIALAQKTGARADNLVAAVDYAGIAGRWLRDHGGPDVGTTFDGTVTERTLHDGRAEIHVVLHTSNALTWGYRATGAEDFDSHLTGAELFGHTPDEILAGGDVALSESHLEVTFIAPTAELPIRRGIAGIEPGRSGPAREGDR